MPDPQIPVATVKLAYRGQAINMEDLEKNHPLPQAREVTVVSQYENYVPDETIDFTDISSINVELNKLRIRLHHIRIELKNAKRKALSAKYLYEQAKKRTWIGITGGSDKSREAAAELLTEELMANALVAAAVADEINQHSRDIRTELDALKEISNNLRRQIDLR